MEIEKMKSIVFALPGNEIIAKKIAINAEIGISLIRNFPDGETYVRIQSDVKNKKVIVVCTLFHPDQKILPLYFLCKTIKNLGASNISLVAPYLSYMRQDKVFNPGEGITSEYFAALISGFVDELITIEPHLHRRHSMSEIYSIPCSVIHVSSLISKYINENIKNALLIGPDSESEQWVSEVAKKSNIPFIILEKTRLSDNKVKISIPQVENYKNHTPVLVDDIISTARTMIETVNQLKDKNMKPPICIGVHPIFADNAYNDLINSGVTRIVTCNTIPHKSNGIDISQLIIDHPTQPTSPSVIKK